MVIRKVRRVKRPQCSQAPDLEELLALAKRVAAMASEIHLRRLGASHCVSTKSSRSDVVTEVDREAERAIVTAILKARPRDGILAEEGSSREGDSGIRWVVDPLDGSVNYLYGYPAFAVSIGVEIDERYRLGVVRDSFHGHVYAAIAGRKATLNGKPLKVNPVSELPDALLATGFSYDVRHRTHQARTLAGVLPRVRDIRRGGSAALDLCSIAAGRIDVYYEAGLKPWDVAAGGVIATAAGARVIALSPPRGPKPLYVAANPSLADKFLNLLCQSGAISPDTARTEPWG